VCRGARKITKVAFIELKQKSGPRFKLKRRPLDEDVFRLAPIASAPSASLGKARHGEPAIGHTSHFFGG
jgi:hypothetical protein